MAGVRYLLHVQVTDELVEIIPNRKISSQRLDICVFANENIELLCKVLQEALYCIVMLAQEMVVRSPLLSSGQN